MDTPVWLRDLLATLMLTEIVPRPEGEEWAALIPRISVPGNVSEVNEDTYWYFLDVLPPKFQRGGVFAFAEGAEAFRLFWESGARYYCRQLTWDETRSFCRLAEVPLPW